jgi:hypothetical protein
MPARAREIITVFDLPFDTSSLIRWMVERIRYPWIPAARTRSNPTIAKAQSGLTLPCAGAPAHEKSLKNSHALGHFQGKFLNDFSRACAHMKHLIGLWFCGVWGGDPRPSCSPKTRPGGSRHGEATGATAQGVGVSKGSAFGPSSVDVVRAGADTACCVRKSHQSRSRFPDIRIVLGLGAIFNAEDTDANSQHK